MCWERSDTSALAPDTGTWDSPPPDGSVPSGTTLGEAIGWTMNATPITSATHLGAGRWLIEVGPAADLSPVVKVGRWYAVPVGMPGSRLYLETIPVETSPGVWQFEILAGASPVFGVSVDLEYECREDMGCGFCRASAIRIEVRPTEVTTDPDALLDGVLTRLVNKILQVVPIHVRIADIVHIVESDIHLNMSVSATAATSILAYGSVGYYYDIVPADELPIDPEHMVASGTVFTIP